jgi:hypothetical protein
MNRAPIKKLPASPSVSSPSVPVASSTQLAANRYWSLTSTGEQLSRFIRTSHSPGGPADPVTSKTGRRIRFQGGRSAQNWIRLQFLTSNDQSDSMGFCPLPPYNNTKDGNSPSGCVYQSLLQRRAFSGRLVPSACISADETRTITSNLLCIHRA